MIEESIEVRAFMRGAEEEMVRLRGYGLTEEERVELEAEARALYTPKATARTETKVAA